MFNVHNDDVKRLYEHFNRLQKAVEWLNKDPKGYQKFDLLVGYFISSDDLRRSLQQIKISYQSYDADIFVFRMLARFNLLMDQLKQIAHGNAYRSAKRAVQKE